jgi:hypothetical protein
MLPNMSKFTSKGQSAPPVAPAQPPTKEKEQKEHKDEKEKHVSMSSIASMASMGGLMTKKLGAGLQTVASAANPMVSAPAAPAPLTSADLEKKSKQAAIEKKQQIAAVLAMLDDVHIQCPQSHTGIILAYTGSNCAPIMTNGIKFTWFRMSGEDRIDQLEESAKAWYAPTVDDIGSVICLQCEDNFYQGCSRYIEVRQHRTFVHLAVRVAVNPF